MIKMEMKTNRCQTWPSQIIQMEKSRRISLLYYWI